MGEAIVGRCVRRVESLPPGYWPIGKKTGPTYLNVCRVMIRILDSRSATSDDADIISRAKGFYGKAYDREKSGMPDWHSVSLMLGSPERTFAHRARAALYKLRQCVCSGGDVAAFLTNPDHQSLFRGIRINLDKAERALVKAGF